MEAQRCAAHCDVRVAYTAPLDDVTNRLCRLPRKFASLSSFLQVVQNTQRPRACYATVSASSSDGATAEWTVYFNNASTAAAECGTGGAGGEVRACVCAFANTVFRHALGEYDGLCDAFNGVSIATAANPRACVRVGRQRRRRR